MSSVLGQGPKSVISVGGLRFHSIFVTNVLSRVASATCAIHVGEPTTIDHCIIIRYMICVLHARAHFIAFQALISHSKSCGHLLLLLMRRDATVLLFSQSVLVF